MPPIVTTVVLLVLSNIFMPFLVLYMRQPFKLDYVWAAVCMMGAVYFVFRA